MYILILEDVEAGFAVLAAAHASLACYLKFRDDEDMQAWANGTFYKVVCRVNAREFEMAKEFQGGVVLTESALGNREVAMAFKPREDWPKPFKFYKLWK